MSFSTLQVRDPEHSVQAGQLAADIEAKGSGTLHIAFDTNKSALKADGTQAVDEVVEVLRSDSTLRLSIEGHVDNVGNAAANQKLSEARAHAVVAGIEAQGVDSTRLNFKVFDVSKPVADNATGPGRAANRRVELVKAR